MASCEWCGGLLHRGRRFCSNSCARREQHSHTSLPARFWGKVDTAAGPTGCWLWRGGVSADGYGLFAIKSRANKASRVAWTLTNGPIPPGLLVCHHCDNPPCVNPAHLFLGTNRDNVMDMVRKGRRASKLTASQVRDLRAQRMAGASEREVADRYGVSPVTIRDAVARRTWSHVP